MTLLWILLAVIFDGAAGLAGGALPSQFLHKHLTSFLGFAAGTLIATALFDLLPEALQSGQPTSHILVAFAAGFCVFFLIEQFLGTHAAGQAGHRHNTMIGPNLLIGDALHNTADGAAIAAAFLADFETGMATAIAVIIHELPQEIGDFAILIGQGYSRKKAIFLLVLVQFTAMGGALAVYFASQSSLEMIPYALALSAGGFFYIAAADLLPELHHQRRERSHYGVPFAFLTGIAVITAMKLFLRV